MPTQGVHRELSQVDMPVNSLHDAENFIYRDGRLRVRDGLTILGGSVTGRPVGFIQWFDTPTTPVLLMATTSKYYEWTQTTQSWTDRGGSLNGDETTHNIMRVFQKGGSSGTVSTMYGTNGVDDVKKMVEGDSAVSRAGTAGSPGDYPPRAKAMMVLGDRMLLGNLTQNSDGGTTYTGALGPQCVAVSNSQTPDAGYSTALVAQLQDTPGQIVAMMEMGNLQGAIYKDDAVYLATAQSDIFPFTFPLKAVVPGPISPRAVVRVNDSLHVYLATNGDVMSFDGVSVTPMGRHIQRYVLDNWNRLLAIRAHGWYDHENNEVVFMFPDSMTGDDTRGINIRITDSPATLWPYRFTSYKITAGIRAVLPGGTRFSDLSATAISTLTLPLSEYNALGTSLIMAESGGQPFTNTGTTDNGGSIPAFIESGLISLLVQQFIGLTPMNPSDTWKSIQYMDFVFFQPPSTQTITVDLQGTSYGEGPVDIGSDSFDISSGSFNRAYFRGAARRILYHLSTQATQTVELQAGYLAYAEQGKR
jgi:hypothetical protein